MPEDIPQQIFDSAPQHALWILKANYSKRTNKKFRSRWRAVTQLIESSGGIEHSRGCTAWWVLFQIDVTLVHVVLWLFCLSHMTVCDWSTSLRFVWGGGCSDLHLHGIALSTWSYISVELCLFLWEQSLLWCHVPHLWTKQLLWCDLLTAQINERQFKAWADSHLSQINTVFESHLTHDWSENFEPRTLLSRCEFLLQSRKHFYHQSGRCLSLLTRCPATDTTAAFWIIGCKVGGRSLASVDMKVFA